MKKSKVVKSLIFIILIVILILSLTLANSSTLIAKITGKDLKAEQVTLQCLIQPNIDIILSKGKTKVDLSNFDADMKNSLSNLGIDKDKVSIKSVATLDVEDQSSFTWTKNVSSTIGSIAITNNGADVVMRGNTTYAGKNAIWCIPEESQDQTISFNYNIDFGDSFNAAGVLLRVQQTNATTLEGYMVSFNNSAWASASGGYNGAIWKFTYIIGQNTTNMSKTLVKGLNIARSGTLTIAASDLEIAVSGGGLASPVVATLPTVYGNGYGFFSDHYAHGCSNIGAFTLTGIKLEIAYYQTITSVLREPSWRENSLKVLLNVSDYPNDSINQTDYIAELLSRVVNTGIHYIGWGVEATRAENEKIISAAQDGIFIIDTNYQTAMQSSAQYIKSLLDSFQASEYLILGQEFVLNTIPSGIMNNTADATYPNGKWKVVHDYTYYENNLGIYSNSGAYTNNLNLSFNKTGKYEIYYADEAVNPSAIYVHRKPVAIIKSTVSGTSITLNSADSYDLDKMSTNRGVSEVEWSYKKASETVWTQQQLTTLEQGVDYVVKLRVKDYQNTWSDPAIQYITTQTNPIPIAQFNIASNTIALNSTLNITDTSYDPAGGTINSRLWEVYFGEQKVYSGSTPVTNFSGYSPGDYRIALTVTSAAGTSQTFSLPFSIYYPTSLEINTVKVNKDTTEIALKSAPVRVKFSNASGQEVLDTIEMSLANGKVALENAPLFIGKTIATIEYNGVVDSGYTKPDIKQLILNYDGTTLSLDRTDATYTSYDMNPNVVGKTVSAKLKVYEDNIIGYSEYSQAAGKQFVLIKADDSLKNLGISEISYNKNGANEEILTCNGKNVYAFDYNIVDNDTIFVKVKTTDGRIYMKKIYYK